MRRLGRDPDLCSCTKGIRPAEFSTSITAKFSTSITAKFSTNIADVIALFNSGSRNRRHRAESQTEAEAGCQTRTAGSGHRCCRAHSSCGGRTDVGAGGTQRQNDRARSGARQFVA
jgi:hypothetical protein